MPSIRSWIRTCTLVLLPAITCLGQFTFTPFDVPGAAQTYPAGVNNSGDIAGTFTDSTGNTHGFIRSANGTFTTFDPCNGVCTGGLGVAGINDLDQVAGAATATPGATITGFVRSQTGTYSAFPTPPARLFQVVGFNNAGETIVGTIIDADTPFYYLLTSAGGFTALEASGTPLLSFNGLNNDGQIVGTSETSEENSPVFGPVVAVGFIENLALGTTTTLDYSPLLGPQASSTNAIALNDSGEVLGQYSDGVNVPAPPGPPSNLLQYESLSFQTVDFIRNAAGTSIQSFVPPFPKPVPVGLNQSGEVAGSYTDSAGSHGFFATPLTDTVPPVVSVVSIIPGPPEQVVFSVVDPGSGIFNIIPVPAVNCTVVVGPYTPGQTTPVTVTATKTNLSGAAEVAFQATDMAGNVTDFDPALVTVYGAAGRKSDVIPDVPAGENVLTVTNGQPGLERLIIHVNQRSVVVSLLANETRTINLSALMTLTSNSVSLSGEGPENSQASVLLKNPAPVLQRRTR
jgi:hypothetical protein